jgi:hypothetical protein
MDLSYADPKLREHVARLTSGRYRVDYTDSTHMPDGQWRSLLDIWLEARRPRQGEDLTSPYYTVSPSLDTPVGGGKLTSKPGASEPQQGGEGDREKRALRDQLGQSLVRCGLLRPDIGDQEAVDLLNLSRARAVILMPDTNSLINGTMHWLARALGRTQLWVQPVSISLTQVQNRDAHLKSLVGKAKGSNLSQALRSRAFVNASLGLMERLGDRYQVLEVAPELLR